MAETEVKEVTTIQKEAPQQVIKTTKVVEPPIRLEHPQKVFDKKKRIFRTYQVVWYILCVIEILLGFRLTLKALGASPFSGFVQFVYTVTDPLALPFSGILPPTVNGASVIEWSTIFGAFVYFLIAWGLAYLLQFVKPVTPHEVEATVDDK